MPSRTINEGVVTNDDSHGRFDLTPTLRAPLSRLTFLSVNTSVNYRATYYSRSAGPTGGTISDPYLRQYASMHTDIVGPVFTRIWDRPTSVFAERLKHVVEPAFSLDAYVEVPDPDALAAEFASRGVSFASPLSDSDDGLRGFVIRDLDGYGLFFGHYRPDADH